MSMLFSRAFFILALGVSLPGCTPLLFGSVGASIAVDQCVENDNEACERVNEAIQGEE